MPECATTLSAPCLAWWRIGGAAHQLAFPPRSETVSHRRAAPGQNGLVPPLLPATASAAAKARCKPPDQLGAPVRAGSVIPPRSLRSAWDPAKTAAPAT